MIILDIMVGVTSNEEKESLKFKDVKVGYILMMGTLVQIVKKTKDKIYWTDLIGTEIISDYDKDFFDLYSELYHYSIISRNSKEFVEQHNRAIRMTPSEILKIYREEGLIYPLPEKYKLVTMKKFRLNEGVKNTLKIVGSVLIFALATGLMFGHNAFKFVINLSALVSAGLFLITTIITVFSKR